MVPAAVLSVLVKTQGAAAAATELRGIDAAGKSASRTLDKTTTAAKNHTRVLGGLGSAAKSAGLLMGGLGLAEGLKAATREYREAQKTGAQTNAVLKSTGNAANISKKGVESLANAISRKAGIDDEAIQSAENLLLTFTKIRNETGKGNDIFNQATQAVTDMSVAMNQSGKASAIQLGKALQDPVKGATALRRVGVLLTTQQQDQIKAFVKAGNTMAAQKIILAELTREFGGSAAAQATAGDKLGVALGNLAEAAGRVLVPVMDKLARLVTKFTNQMLDGTGAGGRFVKTMQNIWTSLQPLIGALKTVVSFLARHPQLLAVAGAAWVAYKVAALGAIAATRLGLLGLFGPSTMAKLTARSTAAGTLTGSTFAAKAGLAVAAGVAGWEIGKWLRANVGPVKTAGDFIGNLFGKAVYDQGFSWVRKLALGITSPLALAVKGIKDVFGGGSPGIKNPATKKIVNQVGNSLRGAPRTPKVPATTPKRPAHGTRVIAGTASVHPMARAAGGGSNSIAATIIAVGRAMGASPKQILAALEAGIVESGLRNLPYGDRDSVGVFQQRPSQGWTGLMNVPKAAREFFQHAKAVGGAGMSAGQLAQAVQRSAFPGRYDAVQGQAQSLLASLGISIPRTTGGKPHNVLSTLIRAKPKTKPKPKTTKMLSPAQKTWGKLGSGGGLDQLRSAAGISPKGMAVDTSINNPWLQAILTHIDNLVGAGQLNQAQGNALKIGHLQNALPFLTGDNGLIAQGMINQLTQETTDANQALIDSNQALIDADQARIDADAEAAAAAREQIDALNALKDELKKNNEFAAGVTATQLGSTMRALADFVNQQIYGNYGQRSSTASSGVSARY